MKMTDESIGHGFRMLSDWVNHNQQFSGVSRGAEICTWEFFDTVLLRSDVTNRIRFFQSEGSLLSNVNWGRILNPPQGFVLESVRILGIADDNALGVFELHIGNKIYMSVPVWRLAVRERYIRSRTPLLLTADHDVRAEIGWQAAPILGNGLSGHPQPYRPIQLVLRGQLARPIQ